MIGQTKRLRRGIMAALAPLMGVRSSGTVTIASTSGEVGLPKNQFAAVVRKSAAGVEQIDRSFIIRTSEAALVGTGGVDVAVTSLLGGARQNAVTGLTVRWDPPITDIEASSTLASGQRCRSSDESACVVGGTDEARADDV